MAILGQVHQFQVTALDADQLLQLAGVELCQTAFHRTSGRRIAFPPPSGQLQQGIGQIEQFAGPVLADHSGQFPAKQADIAAEAIVIGGGSSIDCPGGERRSASGFHHQARFSPGFFKCTAVSFEERNSFR